MHNKIPSRIPFVWRSAVILAIFYSLLFQMGCDTQSQSTASPMLTIPIPQQIRALKSHFSPDNPLNINSSNLIIEAIIDKGTSQQQTIRLTSLAVSDTENTVSGEILGLSPGQHQLELNYFLQDGNTKTPLAVTQTLTVNVTANQTEMASFSENSLTYPDSDEDGHSNLVELLNASDWQNPQSIPIPATPRNVTVTPLNRNVHLTWDTVPSAQFYTIYMAEDSALTPNNFDELTSGMRHTNISQAEFEHPAPLTNDATYYFLVTASNEAGESTVSEKIAATPQLSKPKVPQHFHGTATFKNVELTWEPVVDTEFYLIYMAEDPSVTAENFDTLTSGMRHQVENATTFTHPVPLTPGAKYYFIIIAKNAAGSSARSERIEITPLQPPTTTMPNLIGKTPLQAKILLNDANLILKQQKYQAKVTEPPVTVISQSINSGTTIDEGEAINIDISLPPDPDGFLTDPFDPPGNQDSATAYYQAIDPDNTRTTFEAWRQANGFTDQENYDASVLYFNKLDHLFARKVSFRREGNNIMMYAHHYPTLADAKANTDLLETVAIEYSPAANGESAAQSYVKFFAFSADGQRVVQTDIDAFDIDLKRVAADAPERDTSRRGAEFVPNGCIVCHGGESLALKDGIYPDQGNTQSRLIPFDMDTFEYDEVVDTQYSKAAQQENFRILNQAIIDTFAGNSGSTTATVVFEDSISIPDFCSNSDKTGAPDCTNKQPGIATLPLEVQGLTGPIQDLNISIDQLQHENISDLRLVLESPTGKQVLLVKQRGGETVDISELRLNDEASKNIARANTQNSPLTGIWKPESAPDGQAINTRLASLNQEDPNGTWKLIITDQKALQTGTIHKWSLHFSLPHENAHVIQLVQGWYGNSSPLAGTFNGSFTPSGWQAPYAPPDADVLYQDVIRESCRICHLQRADDRTGRGFSSFDEFLSWAPRIEQLVFREGIMPRALPTYFNFWTSDDPHQATLLASFLDNVDGLKGPRPTAHPGPDRTLKFGQTLVISGSQSILADNYHWQIAKAPAGSGNTAFTDPTQQIQSFIPDALGDYNIELTIENRDKITDKEVITVSVVEHISFTDHVLPIIQTECKTCHAQGRKPAEITGFESSRSDKKLYELLVNKPSKLYPDQTRINLGDAGSSLLLLKLSNQHEDRHGGGLRPGFEPDNVNNNYFYTTIKTWIEEGALFN